ncbi:hypothetical protein PR048_003190 [Dryococelus australis]|uniref:Uncharacterized protein n=1 Tax=Dryococelus australis TaxID=614101 RepID=A0ABQ9IMD7_9NEOP|nr:hypothetical protein PR048_003190 [Dryococelus australis]
MPSSSTVNPAIRPPSDSVGGEGGGILPPQRTARTRAAPACTTGRSPADNLRQLSCQSLPAARGTATLVYLNTVITARTV